MYWKIIIFLLFAWLLLRFVLRFIFPVFKITRGMKRQMDSIQEQLNQQQTAAKESKRKVEGEFIDYEEVK
ncbi:MAG TPA: hypothetical protein VKZ76_01560 [Edaphocola sp.]|nr:hypothetical protein [Edaphocola sp.]